MDSLDSIAQLLHISDWGGVLVTVFRILAIVLAAALLMRALQPAIRLFRDRVTRGLLDPEDIKRASTLSRVFHYLAAVVVSAVAGTEILNELGISLAPVLGAAGVLGLAVGFGAQSLVKDYVTGFFILLENQVRQGDVAEVAGKSGVIEEVTLRHVRLRDYEGNVHFIPNGLITTVTNMGREYAHAVIDVSVGGREDVDRALSVMRDASTQLEKDAVFGKKIVGPPEIVGVESWADSAVVLRCRFKVLPLEQWNVRREFLRRLKQRFDAEGIEIPYRHLVVYGGEKENRQGPSLRPDIFPSPEN